MSHRTLHAIHASVLALLLLNACTVGVPAEPSGPEPASSVAFMVFGDPAELHAYQELADAFEYKYPAIDVELIHVPSQTDYRRRLGADFAAGTPADVVLINYRRYVGFAAKDVLEPLGPYLATSRIIQESDFYPEALHPFRWRGSLVCIPQNISSLVVYYNKNLFEAAGRPYPTTTWTRDDFLRIAQALTKDLDGDGQIDQHGLGAEPTLFRVAPFIWQNRGSLVDRAAVPRRLGLNTPPARGAIHWFVDLQVKHHVVPNAEEEAAEDSESRFMNGRLAMYLNSRRGVPTYRQITAFDWDRTYAVGAAVALPPPHLPQYNCGSNLQLRKSCTTVSLGAIGRSG